MHSIKNSNDFLWWYNKIDKFLAQLIGKQFYIPFTEKVTMVAEGRYPQSQFVAKYQNKLRYFWDLRNQLVHGFSLDQNHYVVASDYAVKQIETIYTQLAEPQSVGEVFSKEVYTCKTSDLLHEVIQSMRKHRNTHIPVYDDDGKFVEMLSESTIAYWFADQVDAKAWFENSALKVGDIKLENTNDTFLFVSADKSTYEVQELFYSFAEDKKRLWAVFITSSGSESEPIAWIITAIDLPKLDSMRIL